MPVMFAGLAAVVTGVALNIEATELAIACAFTVSGLGETEMHYPPEETGFSILQITEALLPLYRMAYRSCAIDCCCHRALREIVGQ